MVKSGCRIRDIVRFGSRFIKDTRYTIGDGGILRHEWTVKAFQGAVSMIVEAIGLTLHSPGMVYYN